jgi:hypothetical protein
MSWALFVSIVFVGCSAKDQHPERSFTYLGKPIDPSAIDALYNAESKSLDLRSFKEVISFGERTDNPTRINYPKDANTGRTPFFEYNFLANVQDRFLLLIQYNGGGTGYFDNILVIKKTGTQLFLLKTLGEGDRCNGGISGEGMDGNDFHYSRNLTPIDIIRLATEVKIDVAAYEDLEASAISCFGLAHYKYNFADDKIELMSVSLAEEKEDEKEWTDRYQAQSCFNKIYNSYVKAKKTELSLKDLNEFAKKFRDECLKKTSSVLR